MKAIRKILSKKDWYRVNTLFNGPDSWTLEEAMKVMDDSRMYTTQNRERVGAKFYHESGKKMKWLIKSGLLDSSYQILEVVPPEGVKCVVQGEFDGVYGRITYVNKPMRIALQEQEIHITRNNLLGIVGFTQYNELMNLSYLYPDHTIEFSIYDKRLGRQNKNMIIWEIRAY